MAQYITYYSGKPFSSGNCSFPKNLKLKFGDIVSFSAYRDTESYIVGKNKVPIENPDFLGLGYLTIPIEITKHLKNAYKHYQQIIEQRPCITIQLYGNDIYLSKKYGAEFPKGWIVTIEPGNKETYLHINFGNNRMETFNQNTTYDSIMEYYEKTREKCYQFGLKYSIEQKGIINKWKIYQKHNKIMLPTGWKITMLTGRYGENLCAEEFLCYGSGSDMEEAKKIIGDYFGGFSESVEWAMNEKIKLVP